MKYSLQCRYSMVDETFVFVFKNVANNQVVFSWLVGNIEDPIYVLTNNNMIIKSQLKNDFVQFEIVSSKENNKGKNTYINNMPVFVFESNDEDINVLYDYDHIPNDKQILVGKIINQFLLVGGGGFLETTEEYTELENNVLAILQENVFNVNKTEIVKQEKTTKNTSKTKKSKKDTIEEEKIEYKAQGNKVVEEKIIEEVRVEENTQSDKTKETNAPKKRTRKKTTKKEEK